MNLSSCEFIDKKINLLSAGSSICVNVVRDLRTREIETKRRKTEKKLLEKQSETVKVQQQE